MNKSGEPNFPPSITSGIIGSTMTAVTFLGQILVFIVVYNDSRLQTPTNYYVISLALADFLISTISMPIWTITTTLNYWPLSQLLCDLWNSLDAALCNISMHTILFISVERYRSVSNPIQHKANLTPKRMILWLSGIWIGELIVWTTFLFFTQRIYGQVRDPLGCQVFWLNEPALAVTIGIATFILPVSVTSLIYMLIFRITKKSGVIDGKYHKNKKITTTATKTTSETGSVTPDSGSEETIPTVAGHLDEDFDTRGTVDKTRVRQAIKHRITIPCKWSFEKCFFLALSGFSHCVNEK